MFNSATPNLSISIPADVIIRTEARPPEVDPTLGVAVDPDRTGTPQHRLVTIGDSLTQGFQSGAIFNTALSYPALIAQALGWRGFRYPTYDGAGNGLPVNLEYLIRELEQRFGETLDWWEFAPGLVKVRELLDKIEDYWERKEGATIPAADSPRNHNLAVYGWDLRNTLSRTADLCLDAIEANPPTDDFINQIVENANERAALRVLNSARDARGRSLSPLRAAAALGTQGTLETGTGDGIETLIVMIGSNNALGSILTFEVQWSDLGYDDMARNNQFTVWRPIHFQAEWNKVVTELKSIQARHIIISTVPHVTIAPLARGVGTKIAPGSRYYPYYTFPWFDNKSFDPKKNPHLTGQAARAIDSAIDQYNDVIVASVRQARQEGRDWYLFDLAGLLDRVAYRRYLEDPAARPSWWDAVGGEYQLPAALQALSPVPDSRFFQSDKTGRLQGGLFALDGIHPTTIGYGVMAQELIKIMQQAGVVFYHADGVTPRTGDVQIDFDALIQKDTLIANPPKSLSSGLSLIGWLDKNFNIFGRLLRSNV
jgi:lysophospholipase L1-like esterase